jgi:rhodanese-related sulfurtransferase
MNAKEPTHREQNQSLHSPGAKPRDELKDTGSLPGRIFRSGSTWVCHSFNSTFLYPQNKYITVEELLDMMDNKENPPLLIDCRRDTEYEESHIQGAINMHKPKNFDSLKRFPKDKLIVTYCAVGLRSGYVAKRLRDEGYTNIYTLKGAFYRWANMDLPMVDDKGKPVHKVVPHQILARSLLKHDIRTPLEHNIRKSKEAHDYHDDRKKQGKRKYRNNDHHLSWNNKRIYENPPPSPQAIVPAPECHEETKSN